MCLSGQTSGSEYLSFAELRCHSVPPIDFAASTTELTSTKGKTSPVEIDKTAFASSRSRQGVQYGREVLSRVRDLLNMVIMMSKTRS